MKRKYWIIPLVLALVVACSPVEAMEPTTTPENTSTPIPTETAVPTVTLTSEPTATPTVEPSVTPDLESIYLSTLNDEQRTKLSTSPEYQNPDNSETKYYKRFGSGAFADTVLYTTEQGTVPDGSPVYIHENNRFVPSLVFFDAGIYITNYKNDNPFVYQDQNVPNAQKQMVENIIKIKQLLCRTGDPKMGMAEALEILQSGGSCKFNFQKRGEIGISTPLEMRLENPNQPPTFKSVHESTSVQGKYSAYGLSVNETGLIIHIHSTATGASAINTLLTGILANYNGFNRVSVPWNFAKGWMFPNGANTSEHPSFTIGQ